MMLMVPLLALVLPCIAAAYSVEDDVDYGAADEEWPAPYVLAFFLLAAILFLSLGSLALFYRNRYQARITSAAQRDGDGTQNQRILLRRDYLRLTRPKEPEMGEAGFDVLRAAPRAALPLAMIGQLSLTLAMVAYCALRGFAGGSCGLPWFFWLLWLSMGCLSALLETAALCFRPGRRRVSLYAESVLLQHLPLLSERVDTCKAFVLVAVAGSHNLLLAAAAGASIMVAELLLFVNEAVRAELAAAYFPMVVSMPEDEIAAPTMSERASNALCDAVLLLLRISSPTRCKISILEDTPHVIAALVLLLIYNDVSPFVLGSFTVSIARLLLSSAPVGAWLYKILEPRVLEARSEAVKKGARVRVLMLTRRLWSLGREDNAQELKEVGYSMRELQEAHGISISQLRRAGYRAVDFYDGGYSAAEARAASFQLREIRAAGYPPSALGDAGYTLAELQAAGLNASELHEVGYQGRELQKAGFPLAEIRDAGCSREEMRQVSLSVAGLREAGFTLEEICKFGFSAGELKEAGATAAGLSGVGFKLPDVYAAGYPARELREAGYSLYELREQGCSPCDLREAGCTPYELKHLADFTFDELASAWPPHEVQPAYSAATAAGGRHSLVLLSDGSVKAFGSAKSGQVKVPALKNRTVVHCAAGGDHTVLVLSDGSVLAFGENEHGQAMDPLLKGRRAVHCAAGASHTLIVTEDGDLVAMGRNGHGEIKVPDFGGRPFVYCAAGGSHSLVILDDGAFFGFGCNEAGQIAVPHMNGRRAAHCAAGGSHSLVILEDGTLLAFGSNSAGQTTIPKMNKRKALYCAAGELHSLAVLDDGSLLAFGDDSFGQCKVPSLNGRRAVHCAAGARHSLALLDDGSVLAFGSDREGQVTVPELGGRMPLLAAC